MKKSTISINKFNLNSGFLEIRTLENLKKIIFEKIYTFKKK